MTTNCNVASYLRLSRDDKNGHLESMSIANQRRIVSDYVKERGWNIVDFYIDDGYSGTNYDRPEFQRMIRDIESGKVNCVITKDLSRLGRNYSKTGYYTDEYFPEHNVRFIAINDFVDTMGDGNDFAAFHNVINEYYPKEISRKVRQVKKANAQRGLFMGSRAPYGYCKSPSDKHRLVIDEEAAAIVRRIFSEYINGNNGRSISQRLNREQILCPRAYYYSKNGRQNPKKENMTWCSATILQIIENPVYIGTLVQGKRQMISFKSKKRRLTSPEEWIVVENTHESIIDRETWEHAQKIRSSKSFTHQRKLEEGQPIFSGLLQCADCGAILSCTLLGQKEVRTYRCGTYVGHGRQGCSSHSITENALEQAVLSDIHHYAKLAVSDPHSLTQRVIQSKLHIQRNDISRLERQMNEIQMRIDILQKSICDLYKDKAAGNLPETICFSMMNEFQTELETLQQEQEIFQTRYHSAATTQWEVEQWTQKIADYLQFQKLTPALARALIEKIIVSEKASVDGKIIQNISIVYRFIGELPQPDDNKKDVA